MSLLPHYAAPSSTDNDRQPLPDRPGVPRPHCTPAQDHPTYLNNVEAAVFLRLSPRTLEKQRVIGGGPRFRKFGRRVMYALADLQTWADARSFETTFDPEYLQRHCGGARHER